MKVFIAIKGNRVEAFVEFRKSECFKTLKHCLKILTIA